jgi:hypothetical protein
MSGIEFHKKLSSVTIAILVGVLSACNGDSSSVTVNNAGTLIAINAEAPGNHCADGGSRIDAGADGNADGVLNAAEIGSTRYVCNGANGSNGSSGLNALVSTTVELPGANCSTGGSEITSGLDTNRNGALDGTEVTGT